MIVSRSNDMEGHYFTKVVTEQRRLRGTTWPRKCNWSSEAYPWIFLNFSHLNTWEEHS